MVAAIKLSALGDIASTLPYLRAMDPEPCIITSPVGRAYLQDEFKDIIVLKDKSFPSLIKTVFEVRKRKFSDIIDFQNNKRCKFISQLSGARVHNTVAHFVHGRNESDYVEKIVNKAFEITKCRNNRGTHIVINAGSSPRWTSKRPPVWKWKEIAEILYDRYQLPFKLTGSPEENDYVQSIVDAIPSKAENLAGKTSLLELKEMIRNATLTISTDSAAFHISKSEGVPTIGIFGATAIGRKTQFPWTVGIYDKKYFPDGNLPVCEQNPGPYYDHIDINEGLLKLGEYCP